MAKTESGSDDQPGTLALCGHDAAEHCRGSAHDFHATVQEVVAAIAAFFWSSESSKHDGSKNFPNSSPR